MLDTIFESIYNKSHIYKFIESRKINSVDDFFNGNGIRYLAGLLNGKKNIPLFFLDENHKEYLTSVINKVLGSRVFKSDLNFASDQAIAFIVKVSKTPEDVRDLLNNHFDTVIEYGKCCNSEWFKKSDFVKQVLDAPEYSGDNMHKLEKYLQEEHSKRSKNKNVKVSNIAALYDTLYDDGTWKLCVPKNFEGDIELSSHIEPFEDYNEKDELQTYTKTRWCTAVGERYYNLYTNDGQLPLYVIQKWENGKYVDAWQIAFCHRDYEDEPKGHIEIMDKYDQRDIRILLRLPKELISKITDSGLILNKGEYTLNMIDIVKELGDIDYYEEDPDDYDILDKTYHDILDFEELQGLVPGYKKGEIVNIDDFELLRNLSEYGMVKVNFTITPKLLEYFGEIYEEMFAYNAALYSVTISDGATSIGDNAFSTCPHLETVVIPESVVSIGSGAFESCSSLKHIKLPENLTEINSLTFARCFNLENIIIPPHVKFIGTNAFVNCREFTSIHIPESVREIENFAFESCTRLEEVTIDSPLCSIGNNVFAFCPNLKRVYVPKGLVYTDYTFGKAQVIIKNTDLQESYKDIFEKIYKDIH